MNIEIEFLTIEEEKELFSRIKNLQEKIEIEHEALQVARSYGDLRENSDFTTKQRKVNHLMKEFSFLKNLKSSYTIPITTQDNIVQFNSQIQLKVPKMFQHMIPKSIRITGILFADAFKGNIYFKSPLGKLIMDLKEGDIFEFQNSEFKILTIKN